MISRLCEFKFVETKRAISIGLELSGDLMNDQFIQGVIFDWNRIDNDSYLKEIEAFNGVEKT